MAYHFLFPEKDTTIYSHPLRKDLNTGKMETLSLLSEKGNNDSNYYPSRILLKFKDSEIKHVLSEKINTTEFSASLKLYATDFIQNLPISQNIELYPLVDEWNNGSQRYIDHPYFSGVVSDGASWLYTNDGTAKRLWSGIFEGSQTTSSYIGDPDATVINGVGGTWYHGSGFESTQSISIVNNFDLNFNITDQIQKVSKSMFLDIPFPDGIPNNGFIIKREHDTTLTGSNQGTIKYFSVDTHTIFSPTLAIKWDDSDYADAVTSSNDILKSGKIQLNFNNLKSEYKQSEEPILRLNVREQYPNRTFTTSSNYLKVNYLNPTSYYSIEDYTSKEVIIPFDTEFTKLSADTDGMYFKLNMQGLQPERYYRLLIRHDNKDGINIYDDDCYFKVTR